MSIKKILQEIQENIELVINGSPVGNALWTSFLDLHPADIADFLTEIDREDAYRLFEKLPKSIKMDVFTELSDTMQVETLSRMSDHEASEAFRMLHADQLTDLFDLFSDEELKKYLRMLHKNVRDKVLSLLQFDPESAGGIMTTDVISLMEDFTVEKSIKLLQRLSPDKNIYQQIYVINKDHQLVGHINLEDLVLHKPHDRIVNFMHKNELIARATEDQEQVSKKMIHYGLMTVPVVDDENHFLGVIPSDTLVDVIVEEASEDVQKMASLPAMKQSYFEASFFSVWYRRAYVLMGLFIAESFAGPIIRSFEGFFTTYFILNSMIFTIISAGGNSGSQASAVVIQGLATGEISFGDMFKLLKRELLVSGAIGLFLAIIGFLRVFSLGGSYAECFAFGVSVALVVFISASLGSMIPFILRRFNIDPALSSGPFLATIMDILGIVIYCYVSSFFLSYVQSHIAITG